MRASPRRRSGSACGRRAASPRRRAGPRARGSRRAASRRRSAGAGRLARRRLADPLGERPAVVGQPQRGRAEEADDDEPDAAERRPARRMRSAPPGERGQRLENFVLAALPAAPRHRPRFAASRGGAGSRPARAPAASAPREHAGGRPARPAGAAGSAARRRRAGTGASRRSGAAAWRRGPRPARRRGAAGRRAPAGAAPAAADGAAAISSLSWPGGAVGPGDELGRGPGGCRATRRRGLVERGAGELDLAGQGDDRAAEAAGRATSGRCTRRASTQQ